MQKKLQPYDRSTLPKNQFVTELGILLAKQTNHSQPVQHHQAVTNLAEYIRVARTHHNLTRSALAQQVGKSEAEIYALEQGLLPYAQIDLLLLCDVAAALGEEVETLILLFGQPALAHTLRKESTHKHGDNQQFGRRRRTISKQIDNWLGTFLGVNLLAKPYRNLVDFWQEGRLLPCIREKHRLTINLAIKLLAIKLNVSLNTGLMTSVVVLVCLLLFGVSPYSLPAFFEAQSSLPSSVLQPVQKKTLSNDELQSRTHVSSMTARPSSKVATYSADEQVAAVLWITLPVSAESQQCIFRMMGKSTLCRL